ncbi:amino acid adenylation domain-containing protein [Melissospora conviva]|uniref:amino acid adenylation domain-containing protein n=1 Tax=Melissospora conviva TaxID=3388432 RepID=UPI003B7726CE
MLSNTGNTPAVGSRTHDPAAGSRCHEAVPLQEGFLFHSRYDSGAGVDLIQVVIDFPAPVDVAALSEAWQHATTRHDVLRTGFDWQGDRLVQRVAPEVTITVRQQEQPGPVVDGELPTGFLAADRADEFNLSVAPLLRLTVLHGPAGPRVLVITFHHAILDGRSLHLLLTEVFTEYTARRTGAACLLPTRRPYPDFTRWYAQRDSAGDRRFWRELLGGGRGWSDLPLRPASDLPARTTATVRETGTLLDPAAGTALRQAAADAGVSPATLVTAAWALLLHRHSAADDVCFGTVRSCRRDSVEGAESSIGLLINTVPLPVTVDPRRPLREWLRDVRRQVGRIRPHQATSPAEITAAAGRPVQEPLFETVLMYDHRELQSLLTETVPDWDGRVRIHRHPSSAVTCCVFGDTRMRIQLYHDRRRLDDTAADHLLRQFTALLRAMPAGLDAPVADLPLAGPAETAQIAAWSRRRPAYGAGTTIGSLFADQVRRRPGKVAVTGPDAALTYAELDARANQLAHLLIRHGLRPDTPVAVMLPRSVRLVVALLAIVKAGGAYLALDPAAPAARNRDLLARSGAALTLLAGAGRDGVPAGHPVLDLDEIAADTAAQPTTAPPPAAAPESLAYLSYTSGSTGAPKAVAVPHRAVARLVRRPGYLRLGPRQRVLQLAPAGFDAATLEIWGALLTGSRLVVAPAGPLGPKEIVALVRAERITVLWLTAGLFHQIVEHDPAGLAGVRQLLAGGDVLDPDSVRAALHLRGRRPVINGYGPTENTTFTACHPMTTPAQVRTPVPIGRPVRGSSVHLLDADLRPVPVGVPGELYTGGDGVARGYHGAAAATADRFLPDPFAAEAGARMYRTGDRARWRPDGTLEFLGRTDRQVKIRGFRVEPAEVESVLRGCPQVGAVAVVVAGTGEQRRLVAYLTPADRGDAGADAGADVAAVRAWAEERLPGHLRPALYHLLPALPLTANGKLDRAALTAANPAAVARHAPPAALPAGAAPAAESTVAGLARLWGDLLGTPAPEADADFFALGGNSLLATRMTFLVTERFGVELPLRRVYDNPGLTALAAEIDRRISTGGRPSAPITARDRTAYRHGPAHLVRPAPGPWAMWRWVGLRAAGFGIEELTRLGDPAHVAVTDALLAAEDLLLRAEQEVLDALRCARLAGDRGDRAAWNRAERDVRQGRQPRTLPVPGHDSTLDTALAALAEARDRHAGAEAAFSGSHHRAVGRASEALRRQAADPLLREAITWQNRHALRTGLDPLVAGADRPRSSKQRQHESLVATYLQRYRAKNDTIGFFGPVNWAEVTPQSQALRVRHGAQPLSRRTVYFENWAIAELAETLAADLPGLRPWLVPRRLPFLTVRDGALALPLSQPVALPSLVARLLRACDGSRTAGQIAAELVADGAAGDAGQVYDLLARLRDDRRVTWSLEVPKEDLFPERALVRRLRAVDDPAVRGPALSALRQLLGARAAVAAAAGDPARLDTALESLEQTFTALTGRTAVRRAGQVYAGRTLVYEDCRSGSQVSLSPELAGTLWPGLTPLLESARWFTFAGAALFRRAFTERYRELVRRSGSPTVPFADFWLWANDLLFEAPEKLLAPLERGLQERWARILRPEPGQRRVQLDPDTVGTAAAEAFAAPRPGWVGAYQHSPDVMLVAESLDAVNRGEFQWVVGEVHPGVNTLRSALFVAEHPNPEQLRAAMTADLPGPRVALAATGEEGGAPARLTDKLVTDRDLRLVFGHDSCGLDPRTALAVGDCVLTEHDGALVVRSTDGRHSLPLAEVVGEAVMLHLIQRFDILPRAAHQPRVTVGRVVIARESWRLRAADLDFARIADEAERFRRVRRWQRETDLPRYVFVKTPVEKKPFLLDFASLPAVDGFARAVRRTVDGAGADATLRLSEMLPGPDQLWLTGPDGARHTAELRMVAVDTRTPSTGPAGEEGPR